MKYIFAGDSWATKAYTPENKNINQLLPNDVRLADFWGLPYSHQFSLGLSNLEVMDKIARHHNNNLPIVWIYTEPCRDYNRITGRDEFEWLTSEKTFEIRKDIDCIVLETIKKTIKNPIALIGGLSDINTEYALSLGYEVLHPSWQSWIAKKLNSKWFQFGWGASDVGWRMDYHNVKPSREAIFAWDDQIKEWCWWEEQGYFCREHPSVRAHEEFAEFMKLNVLQWINCYYE
jgi:hypothetical protein